MKTLINNKKEGLNMIKGLSVFFMLLFLMFNANAVTLLVEDQNANINDYNNANINTILTPVVVGNDNLGAGAGNNTYKYDYREEFADTNSDIYLLYDNPTINASLVVYITDNTEATGVITPLTKYNITLDEIGVYYIKLDNDIANEKFKLEIDAPDGYIRILKVAVVSNTIVNEASTIFSPLISIVVDLLKINLNIWRLAYYILIGAIIGSVVFGFILVGKRIYDYSKQSPEFNFGKRR